MEQIWWNHIIKAHSFLEEIVSETVKGGSILLSLPDTIPWRSTLIDIVSERLRVENSKNKLDVVECPEMDPGEYLLERFCKKEIRARYRYGMKYAEFLGKCQETVLNDRYVWVSGISADKIDKWIEFVSDYQKKVKDKTPGIFILEVHDDALAKKSKKGIKNLIFNQSIGEYDKYAFCALAASQTSCKNFLRPYLAELVSSICGDDVELCAACVSCGGDFLKSPMDTINMIVGKSFRSDGECFTFSKDTEDVTGSIWECQIKYVFPLIEDYRKYFISRYAGAIKSVLPLTNSYGEKVTIPEDVEIGTLLYLTGKGDISISQREYAELERYRNARNKLAHMNILENEDLEVILKTGKHT
ncbi:MAG: hypothetical protein LUC98_13840, partial [Lachnospiraceae bacterium]|nr:hypothetical protein [Lachnospiraceae bacterium]